MPVWEFCSAMKPDGSPDHRLQLSTLDKENTSVTDNNISLLKNKLSLSIRKHVNQYYQVILHSFPPMYCSVTFSVRRLAVQAVHLLLILNYSAEYYLIGKINLCNAL